MSDDLMQTTPDADEAQSDVRSPLGGREQNFPAAGVNVSASAPENANDIYREDIFAASLEAIHDPILTEMNGQQDQSSVSGPALNSAWNTRLLRFPSRDLDISRKLSAMIPSLRSPQLKLDLLDALARYTRTSAEKDGWTIETLEISKTEFDQSFFSGSHEHILSAVFIIEPGLASGEGDSPQQSRLSCTCDALFARHLIALMTRAAPTAAEDEEDRPAGTGEIIAPLTVRPFSVIERAILEFLFLQLARQVNQSIDAPLFTLEKLGTPVVRSSEAASEDLSVKQRGIVISFLVGVREQQAIVRLLLPVEAIEALSKHLNPLFLTDRRSTAWWQEQTRNHYAHYGRVINGVRASLLLGQTEITYFDFQEFALGDVLLLDHTTLTHEPQQQLWHAQNAQLRLGAGENSFIVGSLIQSSEHEEFKLAVISYNATDLKMDEEGAAEEMNPEEGETPTDENNAEPPQQETREDYQRGLPIIVRAELETRKLTLEEVADLHPGQILALGCRANDPVNLVTEAGRVARGELVEIEGRLGVVLSHIYH